MTDPAARGVPCSGETNDMATQVHRCFMVSESQAAAQTIACMSNLAQAGSLGKQTTIRITLYLAQRDYCLFPIEAL